MKVTKTLCVQSVLTAFLLAGIGLLGMNLISAEGVKQLKNPADVKIKTATDSAADSAGQTAPAVNGAESRPETAAVPNTVTQSQSYSVVIESKIGEDGKRVQSKKVWKDGVLVEDEEKTFEGIDADGDTTIELDGQIAPGIVLRSERSGDMPFGDIDPNLSQDEMMRQMRDQMNAMRRRQAEMMQRFGLSGFGLSAGPFGNPDGENPFAVPVKLSEYWLGAVVAPVPPETAAQLGLDEGIGVVIREIVPDSPAAKAGLRQYDIITQLGDAAVSGRESIGQTLDSAQGKPLTTEFYRKGKLETVELTAEKRPEPAVTDTFSPEQSTNAEPVESNEKIRVVRPGMIVPAPEVEKAAEPAQAAAETAEPEK